ncbi:MAG TPA: (d)CMP kinase [Thermodesulfobacteriota bacterium]|nr:(d)CMP kinase [Deltaproteobacteria bacterium]HNR12649.1 (d)CMP kinase [Thermodesulfobacteriota bacterium]HNU73048.1 (d)CMP kinase [Thermodesulfobacteriota bacterium]HQO78754.1 (d)CMP kinase [Thermodesulfobacteriota bacterium]
MKPIVITIDGPSGAGKSSVSHRLAERLGYYHLDSGALYRVAAFEARARGIDDSDDSALQNLCDTLDISFRMEGGVPRILSSGRDMTDLIRTPEISMLASRISTRKVVRDCVTALQRKLGEKTNLVLEGRDAGTVVFPQAQVKFFLNASPQERGRRRYHELLEKGLAVRIEEVTAEIIQRDHNDTSRQHAPLAPAEDAVVIDSTAMTIEEVIDTMVEVIEFKSPRGYN